MVLKTVLNHFVVPLTAQCQMLAATVSAQANRTNVTAGRAAPGTVLQHYVCPVSGIERPIKVSKDPISKLFLCNF